MTKKQISFLGNLKTFLDEKTSNWDFSIRVIDTILDHQDTGEFSPESAEATKAKDLLLSYKTAHGLKSNSDLFDHIKNRCNTESGFDYMYFQQYLSDSYYMLQGRRSFNRHSYYATTRNIFHNTMIQILQPLVSAADKNTGKSEHIRNTGKNNHRYIREQLNKDLQDPNFFDGCRTDKEKIYRIMDETAAYPRVGKKSCSVSYRTAARYLKKWVETGSL